MTWLDVLPPIAVIGGVEIVHPYVKSKMLNPSDAPGEVFTVIRVNGAEAVLSRGQLSALAGLLFGLLDEQRSADLKRGESQPRESRGGEVTAASLAEERESLLKRLR